MIKQEQKIIIIFSLLALIIFGCGNNNEAIPPPQPIERYNGYWCDTFKVRVRQKLHKDGIIGIVFNDTFQDDDWAAKRYCLDSIFEHHFKMRHSPVFNEDYTNCVQPIMDSVIIAKYGINGKDSIIKEAYRLAEVAYKKKN